MITINLCGGIGNQLFQIFTVIAYSLEHKVPFTFPKHKFVITNVGRKSD